MATAAWAPGGQDAITNTSLIVSSLASSIPEPHKLIDAGAVPRMGAHHHVGTRADRVDFMELALDWEARGAGAFFLYGGRRIPAGVFVAAHYGFLSLGTFRPHSSHFSPGGGTDSATSISVNWSAFTVLVGRPSDTVTLGFIQFLLR